MRSLMTFFLILLTAGCVLRPDKDHVLIIRDKKDGGDYFAKKWDAPGPVESVQLSMTEAIRKQLSHDEILTLMQAKIPHSLGAKFRVGNEELVKFGDAYFLQIGVDDLESPHGSDCARSYILFVSADGVPVVIITPALQTCPA